ncbi:alpha/beta hydrolase [uncultured Roseibium sp.]|uniref:alpha/beta hydrolase n=1 Tax=uncultured Roseibium sp. TaxID=1936171 RepID=UPI0032173ACC
MTTVDMEAEYNNRARVPEHPAIIEGWQTDAEAYRKAQENAVLDQPYGPAPRNSYDLFPASTEAKQPLLALFIHGGYWQALDKSAFSHMARGLNANGFDVAIANYSLCPAVAVADIIAEMQDLAAHLYQTFGKKLLVLGHSAGGHLTAALMATDWADRGLPADLVAAGMPISGLFELEPLVETSINKAVGMTPETAREASPILWPKPKKGHFRAVVGGRESDEYLRQSRMLVDIWTGPELTGTLDIQDGADHFTVINPLADPQSELVTALCDLALAATPGVA